MGSIVVEIGDLENVQRKSSSQVHHHFFSAPSFLRIGMLAHQDFESFRCAVGCALVAIDRRDLVVMTKGRLQERIGHPFMDGMQVGEILVVGEGLFVTLVREIGVSDFELREQLVFAVGIVVDDRLEALDRPVVVDVSKQVEDFSAFENSKPLGVEIFGRWNVLETRIGRSAAYEDEAQEETEKGQGNGER